MQAHIRGISLYVFAEFPKSHSMRASVIYVPTCPHANVLKAFQLLFFLCERANKPVIVPLCQMYANVPRRYKDRPIFQLDVSTCQKGCQFFKFACQKVC